MIKALKWAYSMGIRHERVRIASELQIQLRTLEMQSVSYADQLRMGRYESAKDANQKQEDLKRITENRLAVGDAVKQIVKGLFKNQGEWIPGPTPMFPEDNNRGEM